MNIQLKRGRTLFSSLVVLMFLNVNMEAAQIRSQRVPLSQLDLETKFPEHNTKILGFSDTDDAIIAAQERNKPDNGFILKWNANSGSKSAELVLSK